LNASAFQWVEPQPVTVPQEIADLAGDQPILSAALVRRGYSDRQHAQAFLDPRQYTPAPAQQLPGMETAVDRLLHAIDRKERIGVWGDFDVDGQTSTSILVAALRQLGADVVYHIPVRGPESHGIGLPQLKSFLDQQISVLLTCDTGISAYDAVEAANSRGVDVIVSDHHSLPKTLPPALSIINPQLLPSDHPLGTLSGSGVAYKLAEALLEGQNREDQAKALVDLAALGLVADLAQLVGDSRYLVQLGLESMRQSLRPALRGMADLAEIGQNNLTEEHISFFLAPRLNAIGRLGDSNPMVEFLLSEDPQAIQMTAVRLEGMNGQRKLLCDQVFQGAQAQLEQDRTLRESPVIVLSHPAWPAGVIGIVASRLVGLYHRPAILFTASDGGMARGSARSVEGLNITAAIAEQEALLENYGGHPMAAGLSLRTDRLPDFQRALAKTIDKMMQEKPVIHTFEIDEFVTLDQMSLELVKSVDRMAPFGPGNPALTFAARGLQIVEAKAVGKSGEHLQVTVEDQDHRQAKVIWWNGAGSPQPEGEFDLAFAARASNYRGQLNVQMEWLDARQIIAPAVEIDKSQPSYEVIDQRSITQVTPELLEQWAQADTLIWREGKMLNQFPGVTRTQLTTAHTLVIATIPPGPTELADALNICKPSQIIFLAVETATDQPEEFLKFLVGLLRYRLKNGQQRIDLQELAAASGQREIAVQKGLDWLKENGTMHYQKIDQATFEIAEGGIKDPARLAIVDAELKQILKETAAYRLYYLRADVQQLLPARDSAAKGRKK
jgi:single-stranded-DNA-specific exonuclease